MAEGHAIHHLARRLEPLAGTTVRASSPSGAADDLAAIFDRRTPLLAEAHGKHLFWPFEGAPTLHLHLGMFGRVQVRRHRRVPRPGGPPTDLPVHGSVRLRLTEQVRNVDVKAPTICEALGAAGVAAAHARLGEDPLRPDADPDRAWAKLAASGRPIADLWMDQSQIAGVGNVYRAEVLHRAAQDPFTPGRTLGRERFDALCPTSWRSCPPVRRPDAS